MVEPRIAPARVIGWREWLVLPDLGVSSIKAKIDTGARSSALHAFDMQLIEEDGIRRVQFAIHPDQRRDRRIITATAEILEHREIRSSNGQITLRPVIVTHVTLFGLTFPIELTLANRDQMGFRMLLGRQALRERFLVDSGQSYLGGHRKKKKKKS